MRDSLDAFGEALEQRLDSLTNSLDAHDARLDAIEQALADQPDPVDPVDPDPDPVDPDPGDGLDAYSELALDMGALTVHSSADGATLFDEGGHSLHGEMVGAAWSPTGGPGEQLPGFLGFDGNAHVSLGLALPMRFKREHSFVWWERSSAQQQNSHANRFSKGNNSYHVRTARNDGTGLMYTLRHGGDTSGVNLYTEGVVRPNEWQMFAATYDGATARLYEVSASGAHVIGSIDFDQDLFQEAEEPFVIGARSQQNGGLIDRRFVGQLAGIVTFTRAVTADEMGSLRAAAEPPVHMPGPVDPVDPDHGDLSLRVGTTFNINSLDGSKKDQYGRTLRQWYQSMWASAANQEDGHFDRNSWRPWNRTGKQHIVSMFAVMRHTKDIAILDEAVRLVKLAWNRRVRVDGHLTWQGHDQAIDALLGGGLMATVMYACHVNRDLKSPAGHDYGKVADDIKAWLITDLIPRWDSTGRVYFQTRYQQHTYASAHAILWYLSKMPGAQYKNRTPAELRKAVYDYVADKLKGDRVGPIGRGGRLARIWSHTVHHRASSTSAGRHIQFSTYTGGEIVVYHDMYLEGIPGYDREFFTTMAAGYADLVCDDAANGAPTPYARSVAGDLMDPNFDCSSGGGRNTSISVLGLPYDHCYRSRMPWHRPHRNATNMLSGWDQNNRMGPYIWETFNRRENVANPAYPGFATAQAFNLLHHGA